MKLNVSSLLSLVHNVVGAGSRWYLSLDSACLGVSLVGSRS